MMRLQTTVRAAAWWLVAHTCIAVGLALVSGAALSAEAQGVSFSSVQADPGGASAQVTITLMGAYGDDEWCDEVGCYYNHYDSTVNPQTFAFSVNGSSQSGVKVTIGPTEQCIWSGQSWQCQQDYQATGTATVNAGQRNTMTASVTGENNGVTSSAIFQYDAPQALLPAVVSAAPHNGDNRDLALCGATCFELAASYTTVPYISLDSPRSVTLA